MEITTPSRSEPVSLLFLVSFILRDVTRICQYFASQGLRRDARKIATDLWTAHGYRVVQEVHPRDLDPEKKEDRRLWTRQNNAR